MVGVQHLNDDAYPEDYHEMAGYYHRAAVHEYSQGRLQEAQRLAGLALDHRAKAHTCFLRGSRAQDSGEADPENRRALAP